MLFSGALVYDLLAITATLIAGIVVYYKYLFTYWKKRGVEYLEPSIPFGNAAQLFKGKYSFGDQFADFYRQFKARNIKHGGVYLFGMPFYVAMEPEVIQKIMVKDFQHFVDRGFYSNENHDPLSGHLFSLEGQKWKNLRVKLSPTFTSGKMKMMFETMKQCAKGFDDLMSEAAKSKDGTDIKEMLARFTTDVISSCAFGVESNSLRDPNTQFRHIGRRIIEHTVLENINQLLQFVLPKWVLNAIRAKVTKPDVERFIMDLVGKTVEYREKNNVYRKDFLHLLLQLKNRGHIADDEKISSTGEGNMSLNELAAQVFVFFGAGFETSSTMSTFALFELSKKQEIQDKLREEIDRVLLKHNNEVTYEAIMEMTYMDQVLNESLRKYPPLPMLNRQCTIPYDVPGTNIHLEKGSMLVIPISAIQKDSEYYPDPERFDPDRFSDENKNSRPNGTFLPFGEGPRICIGMRFGLLQGKIALATLLRNHKVTINSKTKEPLVMQNNSFITSTHGGIWLNVTKLS